MASRRSVLRGTRGPHAHATFALDRTATFGRSASADIQILDQRVSRQHARITLEADGGVVLVDLSSCNGTYVHGSQVRRRLLAPGDRIQIGFAEYVFEQTRDTETTGHVFKDKLMHHSTLGATMVRKLAGGILDAGTIEMPRVGAGLEFEIPHLAAPARPVTKVEPPPPAIPGFALGQPGRTEDPQLGWSDASGRPLTFSPRAPDFYGLDAQAIADETQPLSILEDSPSAELGSVLQHVAVPLRSEAASPAPSPELAKQAVDTVMRLLALRAQEAAGTMLKVQDRMRLRKLEKALREAKRGDADRRRWARLPCRLGATMDLKARSGVVTDIGAGGVCVQEVLALPAMGEQLTISIRLGQESVTRIAIFQTIVAWVDPGTSSFGAVFDGPGRWEMAV